MSLDELAAQFPVGAKVAQPGYHRHGTVVRHERKHRTDWVVVKWCDSPYTSREYPTNIQLDEAAR